MIVSALCVVLVLGAGGCAAFKGPIDTSVDTSILPRMTLEPLPVTGSTIALEAPLCYVVTPMMRLSGLPPSAVKVEARVTDLDDQSVAAYGWALAPTAGPPSDASVVVERIRVPASCRNFDHRFQIEMLTRDAKNAPLTYGACALVLGLSELTAWKGQCTGAIP